MQILDGKTLSNQLLSELKSKIDLLPQRPRLDIILVGDDPASQKYVENKQKKAQMVGITGQIHHLSADSSQSQILSQIDSLNQDKAVTAFMIQLPLPNSTFDLPLILNSIDPAKDADGLTAANLGLLFQNHPRAIAPATPAGIIKLLEHYQLKITGKNVVIIGRSPIVGLPLAAMFNNLNATVTICHSHTQNLAQITYQADVIVSAVGRSHFVTKDMVNTNTIVIDVGTNFDASGHLTGDVDFDNVAPIASHITPVPGGVGPMTIASLLWNTYNIFTTSN
jgi:methylenetetrahydrofolate dehydrogenase (NADP+)/methenyltetrahydrofolate cyclohydrolase